MLLKPRIGESFMIGDDIKITILRVVGHMVKVEINAPEGLEVHSQEVYDRIQRQKEDEALVD